MSKTAIHISTAGSEAFEEFIQALAEPAARAVIYGEKMDYSLDTLENALEASFVGGISGFLMGFATTGKTYKQYQSEVFGNNLISTGSLDSLIKFAEDFGATDSTVYDSVKEAVQNKNTPDALEVAQLYSQTMQKYNNFDEADIARFVKNTANETNVSDIANMFFNGNTEAAQKFVDKYSKLEISDSNGTKTETPSVILGTAENYDSIQNIDGQTTTGYNNDTSINQDKGGNVNDEADTRGYRENRNGQDTSNRGRQGTRKDSWAEDKTGFIRRTKETGKNGRQRVIIETEKGKTVFAYTPAEPDNSPAYKAVSYLNDLGIKTVYCDGVMESNDGTVTYTHPEAATGPDGTIYVNKESSISSEGIAVHEGTHHYERSNSEKYIALKTVIKSNLDMDSRAYVEFVKEIRDKYFTNIPIEKLNKDKLKQTVDRELVAYTNQFITTQPDAARIHFAPMFKNWGEVVRASRKFNEAIGLDFSDADTVAESSSTNSQSTDTDSESAPTGITELSAAGLKKDAFKLAMEDVTGYKELTEEQKAIRDIGHQLGWKVEFGPVRTPKGRKADGKISFATKTITIDPTSKKPIQFILKHELAHSLEQNKAAYAELQNAIMDSKVFKDYVKAQGFASVSDYNADIVARYKAEGVKGFDSTRAEYKANCEMVANFVGDCLFGGNTEVTVKLFEGMNTTQRRSFIQLIKDFFAKVKDKLSGKHKQLTDEISKLEDAFLKTLNSAETKENTAENDGESYSFNETVSGMANDKLLAYDNELKQIIEGKGDYIIDSKDKLVALVNNAFDNSDKKATAYFGILSAEIISKIEKSIPNLPKEFNGTLFKQGKTYSIAVTLDSIRHLNDNKHLSRGDIIEYLDRMSDTIIDFDEVMFDYYYQGEQRLKGLLFKKRFADGVTQSFEIISNKKRTLNLQTMYMEKGDYIKKKSAETLLMNKSSANAQGVGRSNSNNSILNSDEDVNYSISEKTDIDNVLNAVSRGEMSTEEAKTLLSKTPNKAMTPYDIAHLKPSDADITAEYGTPKMQGEGNRESKLYQSLLNSEIITEDVKREIEADTYIKNYQGTTNKRTLKIAAEELAEGGMAKVQEWHQLKAEKASAVDVAIGLILLERYQRAGRTQSAVLVAEKLREIGTSAGQTVQIFSIIGRFDPEMMQAYAQKELDAAYEALVEAKTRKWAEKHKDRFKLTEEDIEFIRRRTLQAAILEDGTRQKAILLAEICTRIQDKLPPEAGQSLRALQRISLLLNVRTNLRNIVGNANMVPVFIASDFFGSLLDKHLAKKTGVRTTGNFQIKGSGEAFKKGLAESYDDFKRGIRTKQDELNRYDVNRGGGKSFNEHHKKLKQLDAVSKALNKLDNFTSFCLEAGDRGFFEMWFQNSLNNQMRLNNVEIPTENMINIARDEAMQRTWQDNNTVTRTMTRLKNTLNKAHIPLTSYGFGDFVLKFVKTPANIGKAMVQFSPLGFTSAITKGIKFKDALETGKLTPQKQKDFVSSMSNAFVGTVIYALVALLASTGAIALTGAGDEDKDVSNFEKYIVGVPPYSMKIFGVDVTYSWNQPMGTIFATVADIMDSKKDGTNASWYEDAWNAFKAGATVFTEQSFLSSLYELFSADDITAGFAEAFLSEPSAFIPQIVSQVASFTDPYRRTTYENGRPIQSAINSIIYKIPRLRQKLPAQVNVLGETVENVQYLNPWEAFANPSTTYPESSGAVAEEIYELYKATGDKKVMPRVAPNKVTIKGINISFNAEEKADFQQSMGTCSVELLKAVFDSKGYAALSDEEKIKAVAKVYEYAYAKAKTELDIFDYELLSAMEGTKTNGAPILSKSLYNRLDAKAKQMLIDEYFFSKAEIKCKGGTEKLAELFVKQVKD